MPKKGYKQLQEHRNKNKGKHNSSSTEFKKGQPSIFKGKKRSKESIEKQKETLKNRTEEEKESHRNKISETEMGFHNSPETQFKKGQTPWNKDLPSEQQPRHNAKLTQVHKDILTKYREELWKDEEHRKFMHDRFSGEGSNFYGRTPSHDKRFKHNSPLQGILPFHTWDYLYALYSESIGEPYLYEPKAFPLIFDGKEVTYTPDFYLPQTDEYIEVKGYWRSKSKQKFNKFKETYPEIKIKVLFSDDLKKLGIKLIRIKN